MERIFIRKLRYALSAFWGENLTPVKRDIREKILSEIYEQVVFFDLDENDFSS